MIQFDEHIFSNGLKPPTTWWFKVPFFGWLSDPFKWLSDLQLGDEKVTLNHLVVNIILIHFDFEVAKIDPEIWRKKMSPMLTHVFLSKKGGKKPGYQNTQVFGAGQDKDTP